MAGVQKSLLSYFSPTIAPLSCTIRSRAIPGPPKARKRRVGRPRKNPAPTISWCGNQDDPALAEVQDGPALAEVQDGPALAEVRDGPALAEVQDDPAPVALFHLQLMI